MEEHQKKPVQKSTLPDPLKSFTETAGGNSPVESSDNQPDQRTGTVNDEARINKASPPIDIPSSPAEQENSPEKSSQVLVSLPNTTCYQNMAKSSSLNNLSTGSESGSPKLKPAENSQARRSTSLTHLHQGAVATEASPTPTTEPTNSPLSHDQLEDELFISEVRENIRKDKLLKYIRNGCSWCCAIPIKVNGKKGVTFYVSLYPDKTQPDGTKIVRSTIAAEIKPSLLSTLTDQNRDCWVQVKMKIKDCQNGRVCGVTESARHAINLRNSKINFDQDLVKCDDVQRCTGKSVHITIKASFVTCLNFNYTIREDEGFCVLTHNTYNYDIAGGHNHA